MLKPLRVITASLLAALSLPSYASIITLDFNGPGSGSFQYDAYYEDGFRVTSLLVPTGDVFVQGHYDRECGVAFTSPTECGVTGPFTGDYDGTPWLGSDEGSTRIFDSNGNLLGPGFGEALPQIRIDAFGALFTALDFLNVRSGYSLTSSKGGLLAPDTAIGTPVSLLGDLWTDIAWIDLTPFGVGTGRECPGVPCGLDNLRVSVPEPGPLLLLSAGLVAIVVTSRRRVRTL